MAKADVECPDHGWFETAKEIWCHMGGSNCPVVTFFGFGSSRAVHIISHQAGGSDMSTFKRKASPKTVEPLAGTRTSPFSPSTVLTSSGIASLDDILGGGLPLSCSLLVVAPDIHSSYGELVQKYFSSQGLASGQKVCVIDDDPGRFVSECMWHTSGTLSPSLTVTTGDDGNETDHDTGVEIAWRYEHLKQFQTTVSASRLYVYQLNQRPYTSFHFAGLAPQMVFAAPLT
jgi:PAXNEB protein